MYNIQLLLLCVCVCRCVCGGGGGVGVGVGVFFSSHSCDDTVYRVPLFCSQRWEARIGKMKTYIFMFLQCKPSKVDTFCIYQC